MLDDTTLGPMAVVGSLRCERRGSNEVVSFEYRSDYLDARHAVAIDPQLPLLPCPAPIIPCADSTCSASSAMRRQIAGDPC
ncbi:MAG TPA: hypothetical protein VFY94_00730 [Rhodanobacteraceae bacterium]|nr:hypothetical protein [Rhodanobacteraceae bacterium]